MFAVAPVRERGLKSVLSRKQEHEYAVAPVRERGLKFLRNDIDHGLHRRSRKGAWIEIKTLSTITLARTLSLP